MRPPAKIERVLAALIERPHTSRELDLAPTYDHCSHSTVADLRAEGVEIETQRVSVPGYAGQPAHVALWSIPDQVKPRAREILAGLLVRRKRAPGG